MRASAYYGGSTIDITFIPLSREEEKSLFHRFYNNEPLTAEEKERYRADNPRDALIRCHLRLAAKLALRTAKGGLPEDEAISAANYALIQALELRRFNTAERALFSTYLRHFVRGAVLRLLAEKSIQSRVPDSFSVHRPNDVVLTGVQARRDVLQWPPVSSEETCEPDFAARDMHAVVGRFVGRLPDKEASIVRKHFFSGCTFAEIARELNVSRQAVHKSYQHALDLLRRWIGALPEVAAA